MTDFVEDNFSITYADDDTVQAADVLTDYSFVVLYPSVVETRLGTRLRDLHRPVMVLHSRMLDEMGMAAVGRRQRDRHDRVHRQARCTRCRPPSSGTQTINTAAAAIGSAPRRPRPTSSPRSPAPRHRVRLRKGDAMAVGTAPACRVFFSGNTPTQLTTTAWTVQPGGGLHLQNCGKNMLWTAAGNGATAYGRRRRPVGGPRAQHAVGPRDRRPEPGLRRRRGQHAVRRINTDGTVTTIAGTGTSGLTGDGGQATAARLNAPVRLAFDAAGNLFIADSGNNKIRKVTTAGIISTVAGTGTAGNTGDGGQATSARLRTPYDVAFGPDGSMFIADRANHKIRRVAPNGVISTFAGTGTAGYNGDDIAATSARLNSPYGVDVDAAGNVYIADYDNERVRMVDTSGVITTVAGTGIATADGDGGPAIEAGLHKPQYVLRDAGRRPLHRRVQQQPDPARARREHRHGGGQRPVRLRRRRRLPAVLHLAAPVRDGAGPPGQPVGRRPQQPPAAGDQRQLIDLPGLDELSAASGLTQRWTHLVRGSGTGPVYGVRGPGRPAACLETDGCDLGCHHQAAGSSFDGQRREPSRQTHRR